MNKSPDFGKELRRGFEVRENCYDCADFYDGCQAWSASTEFACAYFNRLSDVGIHGKVGQESPPARRQPSVHPVLSGSAQHRGESREQNTRHPGATTQPGIELPSTDLPTK